MCCVLQLTLHNFGTRIDLAGPVCRTRLEGAASTLSKLSTFFLISSIDDFVVSTVLFTCSRKSLFSSMTFCSNSTYWSGKETAIYPRIQLLNIAFFANKLNMQSWTLNDTGSCNWQACTQKSKIVRELKKTLAIGQEHEQQREAILFYTISGEKRQEL